MAITGGMKTFGLHHHIYYRAKENRPMKKLSTVHFTDSHTPIGFTPDNKNIYFLSNRGRDTIALQIFDPRRKKVIRTLWKHPTRNIAGVTYSTYRKKLLYAYYQTEKGMEKKFFDSKIKKIYQDLKGLFPSPKVFFTSARSRNEETFVVYSYSDRDSGSYYTYRPKEKKLTLLAKTRPWMDESKLSPMKPIQYTSRDGLVIEGYLTLPKGKEKRIFPLSFCPTVAHGPETIGDFTPKFNF